MFSTFHYRVPCRLLSLSPSPSTGSYHLSWMWVAIPLLLSVVVSGITDADNFTWWQVRDGAGDTEWVASKFLAPE